LRGQLDQAPDFGLGMRVRFKEEFFRSELLLTFRLLHGPAEARTQQREQQ